MGSDHPAAQAPPELEVRLVSLARAGALLRWALELAIELGDLVAAKERLATLRAERARVAQEYERAQFQLPALEELMPRVRAMLGDVEAMIRSDVALDRLALVGLLGERRTRVSRDGRIEGLATLNLPEEDPPAWASPWAIAIDPADVTIRDSSDKAPT